MLVASFKKPRKFKYEIENFLHKVKFNLIINLMFIVVNNIYNVPFFPIEVTFKIPWIQEGKTVVKLNLFNIPT